MVCGSDQRRSRQIEKRNAAVRSPFGSSQLKITLLSGSVVTRGVMLPAGTGTDISFQEWTPIAGFLHPVKLQSEVTPPTANTPSPADLCSNSLRVIFLRFIASLSLCLGRASSTH